MTNLPRITVVVPSFNQAAYLEEALASIVNQRYPDLELIVMDGGSTDGSVEVISRYREHITHWQSRPDGGQSAAIHAGFVRSTGEIIGWLNSDDVLCDGALLRVGRAFASRPDVRWLYGDSLIINPESTLVERRRTVQVTLPDLVNVTYHLPQESTYFRRDLYFDVGGVNPDLHYAMDYDLWLRFAALADPERVPFLIGQFRIVEGQKSSDITRYEADVQAAKAAFFEDRAGALQRTARFTRINATTLASRLIHDGPAVVVRKQLRILRGEWAGAGASRARAVGILAGMGGAAAATLAGTGALVSTPLRRQAH